MALESHFPLKIAGGKTIQIPSIGVGTWSGGWDPERWCKDAVLAALKAGYRNIDAAWMFGTDAYIGQAIRESGIPRSELFITTKFAPQFAAPENVELCLDLCLKGMGLEYVDLYVAHWAHAIKPISREALETAVASPSDAAGKGILTETRNGFDNCPIVDWEHTSEYLAGLKGQQGSFVPTWKALTRLVSTGKTRAVGVSNFSLGDLKALLPYTTDSDLPISCNQIEANPWFPQNQLIAYMREHDILPMCYSPFSGMKLDERYLVRDPKIVALAQEIGMDSGAILLSWAVQRGTVPVVRSQVESHIQANINIQPLPEETQAALNAMEIPDQLGRNVDPLTWVGLSSFKDQID